MTKKTTIPSDSLVERFLPADYTDAYCREVATGKTLSPDEIMIGLWSSTRRIWWMAALFGLRNFLVRFVGLKGGGGFDVAAFDKAIREGGSYGFTSVPAKNDHETVMMLTDKHLDAWLSVYVAAEGTPKRVSFITLVKFKQRLGRIYFFVIRPFHTIIIKSLLKRAVNGVYSKPSVG